MKSKRGENKWTSLSTQFDPGRIYKKFLWLTNIPKHVPYYNQTMFDVRIFHPYAKTYENQKLADIYSRHEKEKQRNYLQRVLQSEKASFTPLVYSTHGGMAIEAKRFHKKLRIQLQTKINCWRLLTFAMLCSVVISVCGSCGKNFKRVRASLSYVSFNTISEIQEDKTLWTEESREHTINNFITSNSENSHEKFHPCIWGYPALCYAC